MAYNLTFAAKMMKKQPRTLTNQGLEAFGFCQKVVAYFSYLFVFHALLKLIVKYIQNQKIILLYFYMENNINICNN